MARYLRSTLRAENRYKAKMAGLGRRGGNFSSPTARQIRELRSYMNSAMRSIGSASDRRTHSLRNSIDGWQGGEPQCSRAKDLPSEMRCSMRQEIRDTLHSCHITCGLGNVGRAAMPNTLGHAQMTQLASPFSRATARLFRQRDRPLTSVFLLRQISAVDRENHSRNK